MRAGSPHSPVSLHHSHIRSADPTKRGKRESGLSRCSTSHYFACQGCIARCTAMCLKSEAGLGFKSGLGICSSEFLKMTTNGCNVSLDRRGGGAVCCSVISGGAFAHEPAALDEQARCRCDAIYQTALGPQLSTSVMPTGPIMGLSQDWFVLAAGKCSLSRSVNTTASHTCSGALRALCALLMCEGMNCSPPSAEMRSVMTPCIHRP